MPIRRNSSLLVGSLLLLSHADAFTARRHRPNANILQSRRHHGSLQMKNIFAQEEDVSTHVQNAFSFGNSKDNQAESAPGDLMNLFQQGNDSKQKPKPYMEHHEGPDNTTAIFALGAVLLASVGIMGMNLDIPSPSDMITAAEHFIADPNSALQEVVQNVEAMGPAGALYFGLVYTVAEILAIPAFPLTASAGYLFGLAQGTGIVLISASIAAAVSFAIGRTLLRGYVEDLLQDYPEFQKLDKAIARQGFKLMLLLRLSPVFPFALSNYLYGASSVKFWPYFWGTMLGFTPGTIAYVYTGEVGKALTLGAGNAQPWYIYAGGFAVIGGLLKVAADVAQGVIEELEEDT